LKKTAKIKKIKDATASFYSPKDNKPSFNYQPTNIVNTQKLIFTTNKDKAWQRFKEFIKNNTFFKALPPLKLERV
jgi:hypothetical protein